MHLYYCNEAIRPADWKLQDKKAKTTQERLAKDSALASTVNRIRQGSQGQAEPSIRRIALLTARNLTQAYIQQPIQLPRVRTN